MARGEAVSHIAASRAEARESSSGSVLRTAAAALLLVAIACCAYSLQSSTPEHGVVLDASVSTVGDKGLKQALEHDEAKLVKLQEEEAAEGETGGDGAGEDLTRIKEEMNQQEEKFFNSRKIAVQKALQNGLKNPGKMVGATPGELAKTKANAMKWLKWKVAKEEYEQAAYKDISSEEKNRTEVTPAGEAGFEKIAEQAAALDGTHGYEALLNASYDHDVNRTRDFNDLVEKQKNRTSLFPLYDKGTTGVSVSPETAVAEDWDEPGIAFKAKERTAALHHTDVKKITAASAPTLGQSIAQAILHPGERVEAVESFVLNKGGVVPLKAGQKATVLTVNKKLGVDEVIDSKGDTGLFPNADLEPTHAHPQESAPAHDAPASKAAHTVAQAPAKANGRKNVVVQAIEDASKTYTEAKAKRDAEHAVAHSRSAGKAAKPQAGTHGIVSAGIMANDQNFKEAKAKELAKSKAERKSKMATATPQPTKGAKGAVDRALDFDRQIYSEALQREHERSVKQRESLVDAVKSAKAKAKLSLSAKEESERIARAVDKKEHAIVNAEQQRNLDKIGKAIEDEEDSYDEAKNKELKKAVAARIAKGTGVDEGEGASAKSQKKKISSPNSLSTLKDAQAALLKEGLKSEDKFDQARQVLEAKQKLEDMAALREADKMYKDHMAPLKNIDHMYDDYEEKLEKAEIAYDKIHHPKTAKKH